MKRDITVGIAVTLAVSAIYYLIDINTVDQELYEATGAIEQRLETALKPLMDSATFSAQQQVRVVSEKLQKLKANDSLSPEEKAELEAIYSEQLQYAQDRLDDYGD